MNQSEEVKALMNRTGLSLEQIAQKSEVALSTLRKVVAGSYKISPSSMNSVRLATTLPVFGLSAVKEDGATYGKPQSRLRYIPVVSWAQAGEGLIAYDELPSEWMQRIPSDVDDDYAIAIHIKGDSMEPKYWEGETAIIMPSKRARNGDLVVARMKNNNVFIKIFHMAGKNFRFTSFNPAYAPFEYPEKDFHWIYPVYSVVRQVYH